MEPQLLKTKICRPRLAPRVVDRPELMDRLEQGARGKLTLLSAPAGFGKTTLLSQWLESSDIEVAWVAIDEGDNDLRRFLAYLSASMEQADVDLHEGYLGALVSPEAIELEAIGTAIVNRVMEAQTRMVLVLDDYHTITNQSIHALIAFLLRNMPHNLHMAIATRADPPLPLAQLRASGDLTEVRAAELRVHEDWIRDYLREVHGLTLAAQEIARLADRTEGWIAGLQLASHAMKQVEDVAGFLERFSGSHRYVAQYLMDEIFQRQPSDVQAFLLGTALLERFSAPLCDFVTGESTSEAMLSKLYELNLFLVSLDKQAHWFRYHHLFQDLLEKQFLEAHPKAEAAIIYERASVWFGSQGLIREAIDYALRAKNYERVLDLLEGISETLIACGEIETFLKWLGQLPRSSIVHRPLIAALNAWVLLLRGEDSLRAQSLLDDLVPQSDAMQGKVHAVQAVSAIYCLHDVVASETHARKALDLLPEDEVFFRSMALFHLGAAYHLQGKQTEAVDALHEVARMGMASGNRLLALTAQCRLGSIAMVAGDLSEAKRLFEDVLRLAQQDQGDVLPVASAAAIGLGKIHYEWNDLSLARRLLEDALEKGAQWKLAYAIEAYDALALVQQALGASAEAFDSLEKAGELALQSRETTLDEAYVDAQKALMSLRQEHVDEVRSWAAGKGFERGLGHPAAISAGSGKSIIQIYELMVYARLLLKEGRPLDALRLLRRLENRANEYLPTNKRIELAVLQSQAHRRLDQTQEALAQLKVAIEVAQRGNYLRVFVAEGPPLFELLKLLDNDAGPTSFQGRLMQAFETHLFEPAAGQMAGHMVEPLTRREQEVLHYLTTDLSVPEIAETLYIGESTVRTHIKNLYGKLNVHSRFEAVTRGQELGLL